MYISAKLNCFLSAGFLWSRDQGHVDKCSITQLQLLSEGFLVFLPSKCFFLYGLPSFLPPPTHSLSLLVIFGIIYSFLWFLIMRCMWVQAPMETTGSETCCSLSYRQLWAAQQGNWELNSRKAICHLCSPVMFSVSAHMLQPYGEVPAFWRVSSLLALH